MTVYRANYGDAFYGQDIYGLSGSIVDASASVSLVCAVSSEAVNVRNAASTATIAATTSALLQQVRIGASSAACAVSVTASGNKIIGGAASTASTSSASAAAIAFSATQEIDRIQQQHAIQIAALEARLTALENK